jgi:hypothetical protein
MNENVRTKQRSQNPAKPKISLLCALRVLWQRQQFHVSAIALTTYQAFILLLIRSCRFGCRRRNCRSFFSLATSEYYLLHSTTNDHPIHSPRILSTSPAILPLGNSCLFTFLHFFIFLALYDALQCEMQIDTKQKHAIASPLTKQGGKRYFSYPRDFAPTSPDFASICLLRTLLAQAQLERSVIHLMGAPYHIL